MAQVFEGEGQGVDAFGFHGVLSDRRGVINGFAWRGAGRLQGFACLPMACACAFCEGVIFACFGFGRRAPYGSWRRVPERGEHALR